MAFWVFWIAMVCWLAAYAGKHIRAKSEPTLFDALAFLAPFVALCVVGSQLFPWAEHS